MTSRSRRMVFLREVFFKKRTATAAKPRKSAYYLSGRKISRSPDLKSKARASSQGMQLVAQEQIARTVGALFIGSDGKVLLGLRAPWKKVWPRHWDTIGGRVENGESLDDALIRELQEEVGVTPTQFRLVATVRERQPDIYGDALHHVYAVTRWQGGDPANICDEHTELKWFSVSEMRLLTNIVDADYPLFAEQAMTKGL
jgi:8-oxo-dGTP diphosphatase